MSVSVSDFWKLLAESRLLPPAQVQQLKSEFGGSKKPAEPTAKDVAQWLFGRKAITRYQAAVLLAGRSGPFVYGDYKVAERMEKGRLAGSFRAVHTATGHPVLLKFLTGAMVSNPRLWAQAAQNVAAATGIVSPHVQRYHEAVDLGKFKFVVSEDIRGGTLDEKLAAGRVPPPEACRIARLMALGLVPMHASGRIHGNLRPANVVLEPLSKPPANVKLLVDAHEAPGPLEMASEQPGSRLALLADYLAPELWTGDRTPDELSDIYALGCILYQMLAGAPPFAEGSMQQKMARHTSEPARQLEPLGVPQPLAQLVTYLLAKNPGVRYASAELVAEQIALFVDPPALRWQPPMPPATLAAYEQAVREKQEALPPASPLPQVITEKQRKIPVAVAVDRQQPVKPVTREPTPAVSTAPEIGIKVQPASRPTRSAEEILRRRKQQRQKNLLLGGLGTVLLAAALGVFGVWWTKYRAGSSPVAAVSSDSPQVNPASSDVSPTVDKNPAASLDEGNRAAASTGKVTTSNASDGRQQIVPDNGKTLWASPTSGQPVTFRCVPPEGQMFLMLRPAALLAHTEGQRVIAALGPAFADQRRAWETASGFPFDEIDELLVTLHNNDGKFPRTSFVVKTKEAFTAAQLLAKWSNPAPTEHMGETHYAGPTWAYYIPSAPQDERTFAMGDVRDMKDVAAAAGKPPPVFPQIERLRRTTDSQRHVTVLFFPQFLLNDDGEPLFAAERTKIRGPLAWLLGDQLQAACVSGHLGEEFYFEMRMLASLDKEPYKLAQEVGDRLDKVPSSLEDYFVSLDPPPYWKKLAFRYPGMARELHSQMRVGVENDQAIINSILPLAAAHNLVLGGELLVATSPGRAAIVSSAAAGSGPQTIADALQLKTSYTFDQQSLEFAMRDLADDVKGSLKNAPFEFAIKIIGDDLKIDGITRNQSIRDFKQENQTVADILTALVRKANPVTTVKDPSETDQKLVWLIGPDPDGPGKQIVLVTTRSAAAAKKLKLPAPFVPKGK